MTELVTQEQEQTPQPAVPVALAGPDAARLFQRLSIEKRVMLLPAASVVASGGADLLLHDRMMHALHTGGWSVVPIAMGIGSLGSGVASGLTLLALGHTATLEKIHMKRVMWGSLAAGGVVTLFGNQPVILGGYLALAAIATGAWHKTRWSARRALRRALLKGAAAKPDPMPEPAEQPAATPAVELVDARVEELLAEFTRCWQQGVAPSLVSGSHLINGRAHDDGRVSFVVQSGSQGVRLEAVNGVREQIASALRLKLPDAEGRGGQTAVFDQPHGEVADRGQLRLQIIHLASKAATGSRVSGEVVSAPGNPYSIRIGAYIDTGEPAFWDLADHDGVYSGVIAAGNGMGKSSLVDALAYRARRLGFHLAYLDPQRGASSPVLSNQADYPALGTEGAVPLLHWLDDAADLRESWMGAHGLGKITPWTKAPCLPDGEHPDPHCPCGGIVPPPIQAIIEECDQVFKALLPNTTTKLGDPFGELAKRIRKLGMGILAITQNPELKTFGGSDQLRSNLPVRNLLAMHISSNVGGTLIPGLPYSPKLLPRISGRALMCGQRSRVMEATLDWMPRREDAHRVDGPYAEDLFEALQRPQLYAPDQAAARRHLPHYGQDATHTRGAARDRLARLLGGVEVALPAGAGSTTTPTAAPVTVPDAQRLAWPDPVRVACPPPTVEELEAMLAATSARPAADGTTLARRILAAIATADAGEWMTLGDLARRLGRADGADLADLRARARELSAELAAGGYEIPVRRRADGMSATVGEIRAALSR